jgi:Methyltransferase domain
MDDGELQEQYRRVESIMTLYNDLCASYWNDAALHGEIFDTLHERVQQTPYLKEHRDFVESHEWGMNDRAHTGLWSILIETMPAHFSFAEIGCYRGQVLSLIGLISRQIGKTPEIYGISPFEGTKDIVNEYSGQIDYRADVVKIFTQFDIPLKWFTPIVGYSQNPEVISRASTHAPFDILYIDGSHVKEDVRQDVENYVPMLKRGGLLVMDDASCHLNMPEFSNSKGYNRCWAGIISVSDAVRDFLETRTDFVHRLAVGHNRVFEKTS